MDDARVWDAQCACGGLRVRMRGDPEYVSSCCCQACQRRTGSFFGVTAFFRQDQLVSREGAETAFRRVADSGNALTFHFCPTCGSTVWWEPHARPGVLAIAGGAFADSGFPGPKRMIWTEHRHPWVRTPEGLPEFPQAP